MNKNAVSAALCAALFVCAVPAMADFVGTASLTSSQDLNPLTNSPPVSSATGSFTLDYNSTLNDLTYSLTFSGLTSDATMAHIHLGAPGQTGAILFILFDYGMPPSTATTGETVTGTLTVANFMPDSVDGISTFAQAISAIESGDTYVNVHSTNYPAGEIRGQIINGGTGGSGGASSSSAPEPTTASLLLIGGGLGAFGLIRRQRSHR